MTATFGDSFTDDSSRALDLSHNATSAGDGSPRRRRPVPLGGDTISRLAGPLQRMEIAERETIARNLAEDRERKVVALQKREGWTRRQAEEFVDREAAVPKVDRPRMTAEERTEREMLHLMGADADVTGGSSSKSKFKIVKVGTLICTECHLECKTCECPQCECRPCFRHRNSRGRRGRPSLLNRTVRAPGRQSPETEQALTAAGLSTSDALEIAAIALMDGRIFADVVAEFRERHAATPGTSQTRRAHVDLPTAPDPDCQACPDQAGGIMCIACSDAMLRGRKAEGAQATA